MTSLTLLSPLRGWVTPLDQVPDQVFAARILGDGIAVDPLGGDMVAPCDGTVLSVHAARHAVAIRADMGVELLLHLGIDSVKLAGDPITALVGEGDRVTAGQPLLRFDLDRLVVGATAAVTPMLITDGVDGAPELLAQGLVEVGAPLLRVRVGSSFAPSQAAAAPIKATATVTAAGLLSRPVMLALPHGIHARPAARIAAALRGLDAEAALIRDGKRASAVSSLALLGLGAEFNDRLIVEASGPDAEAAIERIAKVLQDASAEDAPPRAAAAPVAPAAMLDDAPGLRGIAAAPGLAIGPAFRIVRDAPIALPAAAGVDEELASLDRALAATRQHLSAQVANGGAAGDILAAHIAILDDPALESAARAAITGEGKSAGQAWRDATAMQIATLQGAASARIAERADDLRDLERRMLHALAGTEAAQLAIPAGSIVLADELLPSDVVGLGPVGVAGIALVAGGPTSHAAILAAGLGIPMVVALGRALNDIGDGTTLLLDADVGRVEVDPAADRTDAVRGVLNAREAAMARLSTAPCHTADGVRIRISANLGSVADARIAAEAHAEGCGLLRTEFLFLDRAEPPGEEEQLAQYQAIADALGDRPLTIRLLDIGGDKPVPYLPIPAEENPMLGMRGVRISLAHADLLQTQLSAIRRVQPPGRCKIMIPMVSGKHELDAVADLLDRVCAAQGADLTPALGIMVETPAAALIAGPLARTAGFFSIGSNDLAQYALAMDRGNAALAAGADGLHPAVLRLIHATCVDARAAGIPVSLCGGLAADRLAVPILLGLGITELSVPPKQVGPVKAQVAALSLAACQHLANVALTLDDAPAVRRQSAAFLEGIDQ